MTLSRTSPGYDLAALGRVFQQDRALFPSADIVVSNTDDGVPYEAMMGVLDLSRQVGYEHTLLAGGAAMSEVEPR